MEDNCFICEDSKGDTFKCDGVCNKNMHAKCVGMTKTVYKAYEELSNLNYMCDDCMNISLKAINRKLDKIISTIYIYDERATRNESSMCQLVKDMGELAKSIENYNDNPSKTLNVNAGNKQKSYADQLKKNNTGAVVLVKPKANQQCDKTEKDFKDSINPNQVKVNRFRKGPKGGIAIICENESDSNEVKKIASDKLGDKYSIETPLKMNKKLKVVGINDELNSEEIIEAIKSQNDFLVNPEIKIARSYTAKHSKTLSAIVEMDIDTYDKCLEVGYIKIMWSLCKVFAYSGVYRCFKCQGYNHKIANCKNKLSCIKCAGEHSSKNCDSEMIECVNV